MSRCSTITLSAGDGVLTANRSFTFTVTGTALETWRFANFGNANDSGTGADTADADGDGANNRDEYAAGTDPNNATDVFQIIATTKTTSTFSLTVNGKASRSYVLERNTGLTTDTWTAVTAAGPLPQNGPISLTDLTPLGNVGFYRVRVTKP